MILDNISLTATVSAPPTISSFTPSSLCEGQQSVAGTNFSGATAVSIGVTAILSYVVNSATEMSAVVGSGITGTISAETSVGTGSVVVVTVNANPSAVTVTGGGSYCDATTLSTRGGSGGTIYWQGTNDGGQQDVVNSGSPSYTSSGTYYANACLPLVVGNTRFGHNHNKYNTWCSFCQEEVHCENTTLSASGGSGGTICWQGTNSGGTSTSGGSGATSSAITSWELTMLELKIMVVGEQKALS